MVLATCIKCCSSTRDRLGANDSVPWFEIVYAPHFGWLVEAKCRLTEAWPTAHNPTGTSGLVGESCRTLLSAKAISPREMMSTRALIAIDDCPPPGTPSLIPLLRRFLV